MSFQAYLSNIQEKTGQSPDDFKKLAEQKGFTQRSKIKSEIKSGDIVKWLKEDFELGHGHSMAIMLYLKVQKTKRANNM